MDQRRKRKGEEKKEEVPRREKKRERERRGGKEEKSEWGIAATWHKTNGDHTNYMMLSKAPAGYQVFTWWVALRWH